MERTEYSALDCEEAEALMLESFGAGVRVGAMQRTRSPVRVSGVDAGPFKTGRLTISMELSGAVEEAEGFVFNHWSTSAADGGADEFRSGTEVERHGPGDIYISIAPGQDRKFVCRGLDARTVSLPRALLDQAAADGADDASPWRFTSNRPIEGGERQWQQVSGFVDALLAEDEIASAPLVVGPAARLLAATALAYFPNTSGHGTGTAAVRDAHPDALRRAIAFIDEDPASDITVADIARAAGVSAPTVRRSFRRHLDTTPTAYLRQVRLAEAHRGLRAADSTDGTTVGRVALAWGFAGPDRFAALYRKAYGRSPDQTLSE